jgi:4-hydroxy-tetrahydrodipicolinate reductase
MGQAVCRAVSEAEDLELCAAVDPQHAGDDLGRLAGLPASSLVVARDLELVDDSIVDVMVDFTIAESARHNLKWCATHGVHAVVGTTGLGAGDLDEIRAEFDGSGANAVLAPNFAIGAVLLMRLSEIVAPYMDNVEIIELHHDRKRDAPSGTAARTAERIASARLGAARPPLPADPTETETIAGTRGGEGAGGVRIHSVRLPGLVAHQEVIFGSAGETLTIRHDSIDRKCFMAGVLLAVRNVGSRPGVTLGLDALLQW